MAENLVEFTDQNFETEVSDSSVPVLVDFWAPWCGPCRILTPIIEELAGEYHGRVKIGKINIDENRQVAVKFAITAIPTLVLFNNGQPVKTTVGLASKKDLKNILDQNI